MEEPPLIVECPPEAPPPHAMSLVARLLNVFAIPGELFEGVRASRFCVGNWLVPAVLSALVGVLTAVVNFSHPVFQDKVRALTEHQATALQEQVKAGKVEPLEAEQAMDVTRKLLPVTLKVLGGMAGAGAGFARLFWWALVLWGVGRRFLRVRFGYEKSLEVAGLALMIGVLGAVVSLLLTVNLSRIFATPSLALAVTDFDAHRKSPLLLEAAWFVFSFWLVGVLSVGLAKLAGVPFLRAAWLVLAFWVIQESLVILMGGALWQFAP